MPIMNALISKFKKKTQPTVGKATIPQGVSDPASRPITDQLQQFSAGSQDPDARAGEEEGLTRRRALREEARGTRRRATANRFQSGLRSFDR